MHQELEPFTLIPERFYAMQLLGVEFGPDSPMSYSPIRVLSVTPMLSGAGLLRLSFIHMNYPAGVQDKEYLLRVRIRDANFVLATRVDFAPARHVLLTPLTWTWLAKHFGISPKNPADDVQRGFENP